VKEILSKDLYEGVWSDEGLDCKKLLSNKGNRISGMGAGCGALYYPSGNKLYGIFL
jgi:hypothetical protein